MAIDLKQMRKPIYFIVAFILALNHIILTSGDTASEAESSVDEPLTAIQCEGLAREYEAQGDYINAVHYYRRTANLAKTEGLHDTRIFALSKVDNLQIELSLYTTDKNPTDYLYHSARYEPRYGTYYGGVFYGQDREYYSKKNSLCLIYLEFGEFEFADYEETFARAKENGFGIELALNLPREGSQLKEVLAADEYIVRSAQYLSELNLPVFLRFGGEMNLWNDQPNRAEFIEAFRKVSTIMRHHAKNVAMVWSPNDIDAFERDMDDMYPGDEYVDWVGASNYTYRYFQGVKDWGDKTEGITGTYYTDEYANPEGRMRRIVEKYGDRKPIMLSEYGVGHYCNVNGEDLTEWAKPYLRRVLYYTPMKFPQVKAMLYFNKMMENENNNYSLDDNPSLYQIYNEITGEDFFISNVGGNGGYAYQKIDGARRFFRGKIPLMVYAFAPRTAEPLVEYWLGGERIAASGRIPYKYELDTRTMERGSYTLTLVMYKGAGEQVAEREYTLEVRGSDVIISPKAPEF